MTAVSTLAGRAVLVTGANGGIGQAIVRGLIDKGAIVFAAARSGHLFPCLANARPVTLDVTDEEAWCAAIDHIVAECGAVDGLVNCAGTFRPGVEFQDVTLAHWRAQMAVNLDGCFIGCRLAMGAMAKTGGGAIVNVASSLATIMLTNAAPYCVSKAGLLSLTRLAAKAGGKHQVRVNALLPGAVDTPMLWRNLPEGADRAAFLESVSALSPLGRIAQPEEVARAAVFLLDPANSFVTGAMLPVDGGQAVA